MPPRRERRGELAPNGRKPPARDDGEAAGTSVERGRGTSRDRPSVPVSGHSLSHLRLSTPKVCFDNAAPGSSWDRTQFSGPPVPVHRSTRLLCPASRLPCLPVKEYPCPYRHHTSAPSRGHRDVRISRRGARLADASPGSPSAATTTPSSGPRQVWAEDVAADARGRGQPGHRRRLLLGLLEPRRGCLRLRLARPGHRAAARRRHRASTWPRRPPRRRRGSPAPHPDSLPVDAATAARLGTARGRPSAPARPPTRTACRAHRRRRSPSGTATTRRSRSGTSTTSTARRPARATASQSPGASAAGCSAGTATSTH